jgi:HSP20 family protein
MPGVDGQDVDIDLRDDVLIIRGAVSPVEDGKEASVYREFNWGDYFRQFTLAEVIDQEKIAAKMDNGILRLTLPKKEKVKPN